MITYVKGNLLEAPEPIIVHGCNARGVMGSGVAKALRDKWPVIFDQYKEGCGEVTDDPQSILGAVLPVLVEENPLKIVINAITQLDYGKDKKTRYVSYDAIDIVMYTLNNLDSRYTFAMPKIGAGLGNGNWEVIEAIINHRMANRKVTVYEL